MSDLRFPIGKFQSVPAITDDQRNVLIRELSEAPSHLRAIVKGMSDEQLATPYRPEGWTVRQVVHHMPDSHMNAYIRSKLAMTEDKPTIKPYRENLWAELDDGKNGSVETSLVLFESLHSRWLTFLNSLRREDFDRPLVHPENGPMKIHTLVQLYAWHGKHHVAQISSLQSRMKW